MSQNHYVTKRKRRKISKTRTTESDKRIATTMAKLKEMERNEAIQQRFTEEGLGTAHSFEEAFPCEHTYVLPNGNCKECGVFVTSVPGLTDQHILVQK